MKKPSWDDVRHFTALAQRLNLSAAAVQLGTSQVTVMRRVKALETALGVTLFLRRHDGHRLTAAGTELLNATQEAQGLLEHGFERVAARDTRAEGRVRIATTELAANWILLPRLRPYLDGVPGMRLEIDASPAPLSLTHDTDTVAVRFRRPESGPYRIKKLGELTFGIYRRAGSAGERAGAATPGRYVGWTGDFESISLSRWLRDVHGGAEPVLALTTLDGHIRAAKQGIGVAGLPRFIGSFDRELEAVGPVHLTFGLEAWLVIPKQVAQHARVRKVVRLIEAAFAATMAAG